MAGASASPNRSGSTAILTPARFCWSSITERESRPPQPRARASVISASVRSAHAHGRAELAATRSGERNVLAGELEGEGRRVGLARQERAAQGIERLTAP